MKPDKKKDALTDVVDIATSPASNNSDSNLSEGQTVASSGEVITLGFENQIDKLARDLVSKARKKK
ncbi:hypothetical protein IPH92_04400 [Candidatus Kaiserbacteria bacterium]|nr:MAG: hypothetical protein IPH92_04400 [Candidatus Kaiserbacteria bacterium]